MKNKLLITIAIIAFIGLIFIAVGFGLLNSNRINSGVWIVKYEKTYYGDFHWYDENGEGLFTIDNQSSVPIDIEISMSDFEEIFPLDGDTITGTVLLTEYTEYWEHDLPDNTWVKFNEWEMVRRNGKATNYQMQSIILDGDISLKIGGIYQFEYIESLDGWYVIRLIK